MSRLDITGQSFGRITVLAFSGMKKGRQPIWFCVCACGNFATSNAGTLRYGKKQSCGCLRNEASAERWRTHGLTSRAKFHPLFGIWSAMIARCENPNTKSYRFYGGRGIAVCKEWRTDFPKFVSDIGNRPSAAHSIDRINVDGNYEPSNCRWATATEQALNKRPKNSIATAAETPQAHKAA